ncbi:hypothetical protein BOW53_08740 [Solemya pervernicosa gill symbiont]|uniref:tRNA(Met) cytidine acetyltransferase TmcA n=2 Tax=Gammaproteobacteria incertae sedis TaxID=118884 RepID=A0A1T2L4Y8_9GAMM|nr:GNAT family N-acetyltransferase [Candidatus Reidiella endopervernicosa]OOZ40178.1 hypothetical protein BOW53_08740 [Solemya pervernicosa gill symbiont]QKQ25122.1 tRNA(Met) cytidine acetyltransferase [Candidatus Reidiella endopervernicosa]
MTQTPNSLAEIAAQIERLVAQAELLRHRAVVVVAGEREWGRAVVAAVDVAPYQKRQLWISSEPPAGVDALPAAKARKQLGRELDLLVFDAYSGFDPDAFGAVSGSVRAGGVLLLLIPSLAQWSAFEDPDKERIAVYPHRATDVSGRLLQRLTTLVRESGLPLIEQDRPMHPFAVESVVAVTPPYHDEIYATADQQQAVEAVLHTGSGHRHRPLVITSDRGRGKSASLGIAAAELLREKSRSIIVTAPRRAAVDALFEHAAKLLGVDSAQGSRLEYRQGVIEFVAPDRLLHEQPKADLLLVDEAAAIPAPLLTQMVRHYSRTVFASTIHGYEGTGRGFAVRFQKVLDAEMPGWRQLRMQTPIRWSTGDPLERFVFRALLLDASPVDGDQLATLSLDECHFETVERAALLTGEPLLAELFGLLVLAHYRTTPTDLRNLLDGPNLSVELVRYRGHVVATALVAAEGGFDAELSQAVYEGRRRVRGHLIPQSLALHAGFVEAPQLRCARVMRIAVHPAVQGRGIGTALIERLYAAAEQTGCDYLGASFGMSGELLDFWQRAALRPLRIGLKREASSGAHAVMMASPITAAGRALIEAVHQRLIDQLPLLLTEPLNDLEPELVSRLLAGHASSETASETLDEQDQRDLASFVSGSRGYELCMAAIRKRVLVAIDTPALSENERALLVAKVIEQGGWPRVVESMGFVGRAAAEDALRCAVKRLL